MKHNMKRVLRFTEARTFTVRAIRAWRRLLPDWTPTLDDLKALETMPHEHRAAVRVIAEGWATNDPRWDVLMALLEWERRQARDDEAARGYFRELKDRIEPLVATVPVITTVRPLETEAETTQETPIKASFLDNLATVKDMKIKDGCGCVGLAHRIGCVNWEMPV